MVTAETVRGNIAHIRENIASACAKCGRNSDDITLMAVTKTVAPEFVNAAYENGITLFGENKVQELCDKFDSYKFAGDKIHFIGHLQSNKVKYLPRKVSMVQSVSSVSLAREIEKQFSKHDKPVDVLIEVNIGEEPQKSGIMPKDIENLAKVIENLPHLNLRGFMTIPPFTHNISETEKYFFKMYEILLDFQLKIVDNKSINILSMGMSDDYVNAIPFGTTVIRVGSAIFGERKYI
jgi:pyridoxal phosphate enzyme, YggS family